MRLTPIAMLLAAATLLTACGAAGAVAPDNGAAAPIAGACHVDTPHCVDTVTEPGGDGSGDDAFDSDTARAEARAVLGVAEDDLAPEVRVGRRGDETFALTEDYVLGRLTVELDADAEGVYRVTAVTVELPDGPETFSS